MEGVGDQKGEELGGGVTLLWPRRSGLNGSGWCTRLKMRGDSR
jgi:hypothetical protein